jgi:Flp pilus assembly protein TadB
MLMLLLASAGLGVGLWLTIVGLFPAALSVTEVLSRVQAGTPEPHPTRASTSQDSALSRLGSRAVGPLQWLGVPGTRVRAELELMERSVEQVLSDKAVAGVYGMMIPIASLLTLAAVGIHLDLGEVAAGSVVLGAAGFFVFDLTVHTDAEEFRRSARLAVRVFLDQTVTSLAGGGGIEQSMVAAASDGRGPMFRRIRDALDSAQLHRESAWSHLDRLGHEVGVEELSELAAAGTLAGAEGAKVKSSLAAKARSMRERELAYCVAQAKSATTRLAMPGALMGMMFILFLIYPVLVAASRHA